MDYCIFDDLKPDCFLKDCSGVRTLDTGNDSIVTPRFLINPYEVVRLFSPELLKSKSSKVTGLRALPILFVVLIVFGEM